MFPKIKAEYIDTGKIRFVFREFPLDIKALAGSMLARCIAKDDAGKYFAVIDMLFRQQMDWALKDTVATLSRIGKQAGLSQQQIEDCLNDKALQEKIAADQKYAAEVLKVNSTPFFFLNGEPMKGEQSFEEFDKRIKALLKGTSQGFRGLGGQRVQPHKRLDEKPSIKPLGKAASRSCLPPAPCSATTSMRRPVRADALDQRQRDRPGPGAARWRRGARQPCAGAGRVVAPPCPDRRRRRGTRRRTGVAARTGQRLVSLEGDVWRWDGFVAAAHAPTGAARRLAERARLVDIENELEQARLDATAKRQALETAEADQKAAAAAETAARNRRAPPSARPMPRASVMRRPNARSTVTPRAARR